ncbi:phage portal protein [Neobacillus rhizosphaerae]|uniref:phage portal protein n=1 Tax=Neobacillus rhizosphaerae TaxID=2880965 RepID=UPI003D284B26
MFGIGSFYPNVTKAHGKRIKRYRENKKLFMGQHYEILEKYNDVLSTYQQRQVYVTTNLAGLIAKKSADFLFGENALYSAGGKDNSPEQEKLDEWVKQNDIHITNYESALSNAYRGDSFYKVRWGQEHGGMVPKELDPFRVIIEAQNAEYVFPETYPNDSTRIMAFHIAVPSEVPNTDGEEWVLNVESHFPNKIVYRSFRMNPVEENINGITSWRIYAEIGEAREVDTNVPFPLVVHVPNYSTDDSWEGIDDLSELKGLFSELNTRLSQISEILSKHADPAMIVPQGTLVEDENGQPAYRVGVDKVFEVMTGELEPKYLTWNGQLEFAFREIEKILDLILMKAEIPAVALGVGDSGTSGSSGLAIKWRLNSLLAKINRKRQYYDKALKRIFTIAQLLEMDRRKKVEFKPFVTVIKFQDGLPKDEMEQATIMQIRTGAKPTISQKRAIMELEGISEEQAQQILDELEEEQMSSALSDPSAFQVNDDLGEDPETKTDNGNEEPKEEE